jgi:2-keto-4-pentenoate hydratase/2-oxohepta-3-ene-1,7-dioic acid hydratase in catechol pathway
MAEWFALVAFEEHGAPVVGTLIRDKIIPLDAGYSHFQRQARAPALMDRGASPTVLNLLRHYPDSFDRLGAMADFFARAGGDLQQLALDPASVRLLAPVLNPAKMLFAGANYTDHVEEMKAPPVDKTKAKPYFFPKTNNCIVGPYEPIKLPAASKQVDWEIELAVVIGRRCKDVPLSRAREVIAGYTIMNDLSARDITRRTDVPFNVDWVSGKCIDGFAPMGPALVPSRFVPHPDNLWLKLSVNGHVMQDSNTSKLIFGIDEQIEFLSKLMTLEPGDIISTGTPAGVGHGRGIYLKPGDRIVAAIEGLGEQRNKVVQ